MRRGPKYPEITVRLSGTDGNAMALVSRVTAALRRAGVTNVVRDAFVKEAMSGDYDHVIQTCMAWVDVS